MRRANIGERKIERPHAPRADRDFLNKHPDAGGQTISRPARRIVEIAIKQDFRQRCRGEVVR